VTVTGFRGYAARAWGVVTVPEPDQVGLGKLPKRSDPRTLSLPALLTGEITAQAAASNEDHRPGKPWAMLGNDELEDCAVAAAAHAEMLWAAMHRPGLPDPTLTQVIDAYSKITGYKPEDQTTDKGADLLSVLKYWKQTGIADQKIGAFAEILPRDVGTLRWTIANLDLAYVGLQLPAAWKTPHTTDPRPRFTPERKTLNPATWQNPYRGHCVIYTGYTEDSFTCVSWGELVTVPLSFHQAYCDEAYAIIAPRRLHGLAAAPSQLDITKLKRTLAQVKKWPPPATSRS
jgi:hypothetical protein